jgi:hypothetical protein
MSTKTTAPTNTANSSGNSSGGNNSSASGAANPQGENGKDKAEQKQRNKPSENGVLHP